MSLDTFKHLVSIAGTITLTLAVVYLVAAVVGWRGPHRKRRLTCFVFLVLALPLFAFAPLLFIVFVELPRVEQSQNRQWLDTVDAASLIRVGDPVPSFSLVDPNGQKFVLDDQRGKVVLLNFFATSCGPCLRELPEIQRLWTEHRDDPEFVLLVIGREETDESVREFQSKHGYTFPIASDPDGSVYALFADKYIPRSYLISRDGKVCLALTGFDESEMGKLEVELVSQLGRVQYGRKGQAFSITKPNGKEPRR
jgi:peroxiredoxin